MIEIEEVMGTKRQTNVCIERERKRQGSIEYGEGERERDRQRIKDTQRGIKRQRHVERQTEA